MDQVLVHTRTRVKGVSRGVYWLFRAPLQLFFHVYFRMSRIGSEHFPAKGPHKVRVRAGMPIRFAQADIATPAAAGDVTASIWACVKLQWGWLGGVTERQAEPARETADVA